MTAPGNATPRSDAAIARVFEDRTIVLVIGGGIAAYKTLDLIRRLVERGARVVPIMTRGAHEFVTPLSVGALSASRVYSDLFDREDEQDVGHIRLARNADTVVVAPLTASRMAAMASGLASDLAGAVLLATRAPVLGAPAMNPAMWDHPATQRNQERLIADGVRLVGPESGEMAERGESGTGRMSEPMAIVDALADMLGPKHARNEDRPLSGKRALVTSGPTHEPIDPVRYLANRSSGKQGHAIAEALRDLGATVMLVSGPVALPDPQGVETLHVETARDMLDASLRVVEGDAPPDIAVMVAAVADWRVEGRAADKIKKGEDSPPTLRMVENPDILATVGHHEQRPALVIGFAAETRDLERHAKAKLERKGADWIVANDVSVGADGTGVMGGDRNTVHLVTRDGVEAWPTSSKREVAERLAERIALALDGAASRRNAAT